MRTGLVSKLKSGLVSDVTRPRTVPLGLYKGLRIDINLQNQSQLYVGLWERETHGAIRRALRRAAWCIDVGAGAGELAILFARSESVRKVVAIEPNPANALAMRANLAHNGLPPDRIEVLEKLAGSGEGANYVPLDALDVDRTAPGFLKIDVDGAELDVLQSGSDLLSQADVELLVETHSLQLERDCLSYLAGLGYTCRVIDNAWWRRIIPEQRPTDHNRWFAAARHRT